MLLACVAVVSIHPALCIALMLWRREAEGRQPGSWCLPDPAGPPGPLHGLYPFCRGANQQPGLLLPHPSEIRCRQKLLRVPWPVVLPQGNCCVGCGTCHRVCYFKLTCACLAEEETFLSGELLDTGFQGRLSVRNICVPCLAQTGFAWRGASLEFDV